MLQRALAASAAVVIEGARACGKTMTALHASSSYVLLDEPEAHDLLAVSPRSLLEGSAPRLLDEWQLAPELWNLVRRAVDASPQAGLSRDDRVDAAPVSCSVARVRRRRGPH
ncbi:AAA family ATPase [Propionibacteriaceae bacterium G1746]|uniref:AAA family ATPase n=1 Tax=Aestuariimicrobium sp. G57 TaxID=3418485 RepID=UPI003C245253